jgi:hypothetical protein
LFSANQPWTTILCVFQIARDEAKIINHKLQTWSALLQWICFTEILLDFYKLNLLKCIILRAPVFHFHLWNHTADNTNYDFSSCANTSVTDSVEQCIVCENFCLSVDKVLVWPLFWIFPATSGILPHVLQTNSETWQPFGIIVLFLSHSCITSAVIIWALRNSTKKPLISWFCKDLGQPWLWFLVVKPFSPMFG